MEEVLLFQMRFPKLRLVPAAVLMLAAGVTVPSKSASSVVTGVPVADQLVEVLREPLVVFQVLVAAVAAGANAKPREIARNGAERRVECLEGFVFIGTMMTLRGPEGHLTRIGDAWSRERIHEYS